MPVSPDCSAAQPCFPSRDPGQRYFSPWDSAWCRMIPHLFTQISLSNHTGGHGRMCHQSLAAGGAFLRQFTTQGESLFPQWRSFTFRKTKKINFWAGCWIQICILSSPEVAQLCHSGLIYPRNKMQQLPSDANLDLKALLSPSHTIWKMGFSIFC